ncbi:MAG TPA: multidrug effflux MFS transporter [Aestuariivirgaceae bacterium]|nr:multidrug effflux MFS transporter [Aestuariivirgaceae bacterium]
MKGSVSAAPGAVMERPPYGILVAVSAVGPLALNIFVPSMPGLQSEFGVSYGVVQLTLTLYLIGMALCQLAYGPLSDRFGRRPVLLAGMTLFVAASVMAALATSIGMLIAARLLQAVGGASGLVLSRAIVRDLYDRDRSASVLGYITMAFVIAPMLAPTIGGLLDQLAGWRASFVLLALLGIAALAATWRKLPETNRNRAPSIGLHSLLAGYARLVRMPSYLAYAFTLGFASAVFFAFIAGAPYVMVVVLGQTPLDYGLWFMIVSLGYMTGNFLSGRYSQRVGTDRMVTIGNLVTMAAGLACLAAAVAGIMSPVTLFVPMLFAALGNGLTIPNGTAGAISVDTSMVGAAAGLAGFLQMGIGAGSAQLVGVLQDAEPFAVFWIMAAAAALATLTHRLALRGRANFRSGSL